MTIIRDILLALPSYRKRTPEGEQILLLVLDKAEKVLSEELREVNDGGLTSLDGTRRYLELAGNVMATASRQQPLWKFYFDFIVDRINSLTPDTQLWLVQTVLAVVDSYGDVDRSADAREARKQACDHSQALFKVWDLVCFVVGTLMVAFSSRFWRIVRLLIRRFGRLVRRCSSCVLR
jgi:hypothetical protein